MSPRILYFDIETFPLLAHVWSKFVDGPVVSIEREWSIASIAWKWEGEKRTHAMDARDDIHDDTDMVVKLHELFDEADVVIGHNANGFDIKKAQGRMLLLGLTPPSPFLSIDTLTVVKRHFKLTSNRLGDVCEALGLGGKVSTGGWELWAQCLAGDERAWNKMVRYNKQDVALLPDLYHRLRPWISNHPVLHDSGCPKCGSDHSHGRGYYTTKSGTKYQQRECQDCGGYFSLPGMVSKAESRDITRR